jgi:hypothetical protein
MIGPRASRRVQWGLLFAAVLLVHGSAVLWLETVLVGWGAGEQAMPARMEVAFVKELAPAAPPATPARPLAPRAAPGRKARAAIDAAAAASAPASASQAPPVPAPEATLVPATVVAEAAPPTQGSANDSLPAPPATVEPPAGPAASSAAAPSFEWPPSTRLNYSLVGNYRGEVHGRARVQWVRIGARYQVHLDVAIGPPFAPLMSRRMTSDGDLGETGLVPRRYDEATKLPFQAPRRATVQFIPGQVTLGNGAIREAPAGVQDAASQFVQLTWLFTTRPELLRVGNTVELPLALPRRVDRWRYDVVGEQRLSTPVGAVDTFHLKPRRADERPRGELSAEVWFAPSLQYLPVRIRIQQDAENYLDLMMDTAPLQAEPQAPR